MQNSQKLCAFQGVRQIACLIKSKVLNFFVALQIGGWNLSGTPSPPVLTLPFQMNVFTLTLTNNIVTWII